MGTLTLKPLKQIDFLLCTNMNRVLLTRSFSQGRTWAGYYIDPEDFGPGGAVQNGERVSFNYYDGTPFCNNFSLKFKSIEEAKEFISWFNKLKPYCVYESYDKY